MKEPLVSVCIPVFNVATYLESTIESVLNQTYKNIEIILVDDSSRDRSLEIAKNYECSQVKVYRQENKGASAARNAAFSGSRGEYIKFLDGDDLINPAMIESQVRLAVENDGCLISAQWGRFYHDDLKTFIPISDKNKERMAPVNWLRNSWTEGKSMMQPGIFLIPRKLVERAGFWDENLSLIDDLDFFTRVILESKEVIFSEEAILYYRSGIHGSLSTIQSDSALRSAFQSIDKSVNNLLAANSDKETLLACANVWQNFIYSVYPRQPQLIKAAENSIKSLNGSSFSFPCGGMTKFMVSILGWKLTKKIKLLFNA